MLEKLLIENLDSLHGMAEAALASYVPWILDGGKAFLKAATEETAKFSVKMFGQTCTRMWDKIKSHLSPEQQRVMNDFEKAPDGPAASDMLAQLIQTLHDNESFAAEIRTELQQLCDLKEHLPAIEKSFNDNTIVSTTTNGNSANVIGSNNQINF